MLLTLFLADYGKCLMQIIKQMEKLYLGSFLLLDFPSVQHKEQQHHQQQRLQMVFSGSGDGSGLVDNLITETQQTETNCVGHCFTLKVNRIIFTLY